jgi:putative SOS response-associated peptidase YedK
MPTINADKHPMFMKLHRPDLKRPPDKQDKRMVVIMAEENCQAWLNAPTKHSKEFLQPFAASQLSAVAEPKTLQVADLLNDQDAS